MFNFENSFIALTAFLRADKGGVSSEALHTGTFKIRINFNVDMTGYTQKHAGLAAFDVNTYICHMSMTKISIFLLATVTAVLSFGQQTDILLEDSPRPQVPIMGWSSWNHFWHNIDEQIVRETADAMITSGMQAAGYEYINIDDGYFGGRASSRELLCHPEKFKSGMRALADYIHLKGLRAGIYTDAGKYTCGFYNDGDINGVNAGLYSVEEADIYRFLIEWNYDFLKVDWCGGHNLGLDKAEAYGKIGKLIRDIKPGAVYNICCWQFPGEWALDVADSWRISGDIQPEFRSVTRIIDLNADLWMYAGPGHVNDMDMLQVGRGMRYEEDKAHFSMWCMMASPLLAGNDLRHMSEETLSILTNREMIALNQDPLVYQARRMQDHGKREVWAKPLGSVSSGTVAVALLNRSRIKRKITFDLAAIGIIAEEGYTMRDLWSGRDYEASTEASRKFKAPRHGVVVLRISGNPAAGAVYDRP
jgi:hypothetical protein